MKTILRLICIILCLSTLTLTACTTTSTNNDIVEAGKNDSPQNNNGIVNAETNAAYKEGTVNIIMPEAPIIVESSLGTFKIPDPTYRLREYGNNNYNLKINLSGRLTNSYSKYAEGIPFSVHIIDPEGNKIAGKMAFAEVKKVYDEAYCSVTFDDLKLDPSKTYTVRISAD